MKEKNLLKALDRAIFRGIEDEVLLNSIIPGGKLNAQRCLDLLRESVLAVSEDILRSTYGKTIEKADLKYNKGVLNEMIEDYCQSNPSEEYNIMTYAESFSRSLTKFDVDLSEYARFEYMMHLLQYNPSKLNLTKHQFEIQGHRLETSEFLIEKFNIDVDRDNLEGSCILYMYLKNQEAYYYPLNSRELLFLNTVKSRELIEGWFDTTEMSSEEIQSMFESFAANQMITKQTL